MKRDSTTAKQHIQKIKINETENNTENEKPIYSISKANQSK